MLSTHVPRRPPVCKKSPRSATAGNRRGSFLWPLRELRAGSVTAREMSGDVRKCPTAANALRDETWPARELREPGRRGLDMHADRVSKCLVLSHLGESSPSADVARPILVDAPLLRVRHLR